LAAEAGQLQLNVMEPIIAYCILESQTMFMNAASTLRRHCVEGITANADTCRKYVEHSIGVVTALNPLLGYETANLRCSRRRNRGEPSIVNEFHPQWDIDYFENLAIWEAHCRQHSVRNGVDPKGVICFCAWPRPAGFIYDRIIPMPIYHRFVPVVFAGK